MMGGLSIRDGLDPIDASIIRRTSAAEKRDLGHGLPEA